MVMSETEINSGGCLCGAVRFSVDQAITGFSACHCTMCRGWASGPFLAADCGTDVRFEGDDSIAEYRSSQWAERGFCKICGSNLFYFHISAGRYYMAVGAFDALDGLDMSVQVFIDEKPDCYAFVNQTKEMTGAEVFALYAPKM
jgi:hypothetical protein